LIETAAIIRSLLMSQSKSGLSASIKKCSLAHRLDVGVLHLVHAGLSGGAYSLQKCDDVGIEPIGDPGRLPVLRLHRDCVVSENLARFWNV
jgi:hypothetical protein